MQNPNRCLQMNCLLLASPMKTNSAEPSGEPPPLQEEEKFRAFFELAGVGNAVVDVRTRRFVKVNRRFEEITGYTAEELCCRRFGDITHPEDRARDEARFHELVSGQHAQVRLEKRYVRKDGQIIWVHLTTTLLRGSDGCARLQLGVVTDITAQKAAQDEVAKLQGHLRRLVDERTAALADKSAQLEAFVYIVAHDLRAPLRAINGYAEFVAEDRGTTLSPGSLSFLNRVKKAARRMDSLIRDLLSYTRMTQVELRIERVPLEECVDWALAGLRDDIEGRGAEVIIDSPLPSVRGDRGSLEQVIWHFIANALKFVVPGERPRIRVHGETHDGSVRLCITDNGIGIRSEYHDRVFRIFERLEDARTYPGTGIGLPIVNKTIERLGGRVGLESNHGRGSTFWFELKEAEQ